MPDSEPVIRDISDTARWAAVFRGWESERSDALFHDPWAARLAGERGPRIAAAARFATRHTWSWIARTWLFDQVVLQAVHDGFDQVVNLAAGLDTRPYRLSLPAHLHWVEVDLPGILDYKEEVLAGATPVCRLTRLRLDLRSPDRRPLLQQLGREAARTLVLSEGLVIYLPAREAGALGEDLAAAGMERWALDLVSPRLLRLMQRRMGTLLDEASAHLAFAPADGPGFFAAFGWRAVEVHSMLHTAARIGRLPWRMRPFVLLPARFPAHGKSPWSGVCVFERIGPRPVAVAA